MKIPTVVVALIFVLSSLHADERKETLDILGAVNRSTRVEITEPISVMEAAERAGGTARIWWREFTIKRKESDLLTVTYHYNLRALSEDERIAKMKSIQVKSGDRLWFKEVVD